MLASFRLVAKKPWAIDPSYFSPCRKALYLVDMAVAPQVRRQGIGRSCLEHVRAEARRWPADAIRLDAFDVQCGAGPFYARCGFTEVGRITYRKAPLIYFELLFESSSPSAPTEGGLSAIPLFPLALGGEERIVKRHRDRVGFGMMYRPQRPVMDGVVAQLVERLVRNKIWPFPHESPCVADCHHTLRS